MENTRILCRVGRRPVPPPRTLPPLLRYYYTRGLISRGEMFLLQERIRCRSLAILAARFLLNFLPLALFSLFILTVFFGSRISTTVVRPARGHACKLTPLVRNYRSLIFQRIAAHVCYRCCSGDQRNSFLPGCFFLVQSLRFYWLSRVKISLTWRVMERNVTEYLKFFSIKAIASLKISQHFSYFSKRNFPSYFLTLNLETVFFDRLDHFLIRNFTTDPFNLNQF